MKKFKLKPGLNKVYEITEENYNRFTGRSSMYREYTKDGSVRELAVCPACDNPIQIIGLHKRLKHTEHPYGKHYGHNTKIAKHNETTYLFCPYASRKWNTSKKNLKEEMTDAEKSLYNAVRENFDYAIFLAENVTGLKISTNFARQILNDYLGSKGYLYYYANAYNIPWMLLYFMVAKTCHYKLVKKDSPLYQMIEKCKYARLMKTSYGSYYRIEKVNLSQTLEFSFLLHDKKIIDDELHEFVTMVLVTKDENDLPKILDECKLEINESRFPNLIHSEKAQSYRNEEVLRIAKELMAEL